MALVPFTTNLLGTYSDSQVAIARYGANIIIIGVLLFAVRGYIRRPPNIENANWTPEDRRNGTIRIMFPIVSALLAIPIGFWSQQVSLSPFTFAMLFNLSDTSTQLINWCISCVFKKPVLTHGEAVM